VGIGTDSPSNDVSGLHIAVNSSTDQLYLERTGSGTGKFYLGTAANSFLIVDAAQSEERLRIDSSGRVGIGTTSPSYKFTAYGSNTDSEIVASFGSSNDAYEYTAIGLSGFIAANGATKAGLALRRTTSYGAGELHFLNNTTTDNSDMTLSDSKMMIDSSGNVGIGTTSPGYKLDVNGVINVSDNNPIRSGNQIMIRRTNSTNLLRIGSGDGNDATQFYAGGSEKMRIDSSGNVGIGTTSPSRTLEVNSGTASDIAKIGNNSGAFTFGYSASLASIDLAASNAFRIRQGGVVPFYIKTDGNVGIGTSSPFTNLTVYGATDSRIALINSNSGTTSSDGFVMILEDDSEVNFLNRESAAIKFATAGTERMRIDSSGDVTLGAAGSPKFYMRSDGGNGNNQRFYIDGFADGGGAGYGGGFRIHTRDTVNIFHERMRITSGGGVLIGTTGTPNGTSNYGSAFNVESVGRRVLRMASSSTASQNLVFFYNPNGQVGRITTNGSATAYNTSSDYRLKENVVEMTGALDRVDALKPSRFNFIADADKTVDGFLAHEVADVVPEAISGEKDAVDEEGNAIYQGIDQSKLVPLLVGAIQELKAEIETLKSQIQ
jgi:hypothetical protein